MASSERAQTSTSEPLERVIDDEVLSKPVPKIAIAKVAASAPRPKFDEGEMMRLAIETMKKSLAEPRKDGKVLPLVGAVLVKPDGTVETAYRGELRNGDHAEFTLLERKNRHSRLDGAILFATLEPCAEGSRNAPKVCCTERILNARIKEVWIGIQDPDPTVDREGIRCLQSNGVIVHMFPRALQEEIEAANKDFLAQAVERRAAAEKSLLKNAKSFLKKLIPAADMTLFSVQALADYRKAAQIPSDATDEMFYHHLELLGLVKPLRGALVPTGFGILLLGQHPRQSILQAGMLGTIRFPDGSEEIRDFDGPLVEIPEQVLEWLKNKLPNLIDRSEARRRTGSPVLDELIREGVVNALVHRDYDIGGAKCLLVVTEDTIVIKSPGQPVTPITLGQLRSFDAPTLSRNPILHYVFAQLELAEERGLGLKSMKAHALSSGLPSPDYTWEPPNLVLTLYRTKEARIRALPPRRSGLPSQDEVAVLELILETERTTSNAIMERLKFDERKTQRILRSLLDGDFIERSGKGRATEYSLAESPTGPVLPNPDKNPDTLS